MKKTYINPSILSMELKTEQMLAVSGVEAKKGRIANGTEALSYNPWGAENFMPGNEEDVYE